MVPKDFLRILAISAAAIAVIAAAGLFVDPRWSLSLAVLGVATIFNFWALGLILVAITNQVPKFVFIALIPLKIIAILTFLVIGTLGLLQASTLLIAFNTVFLTALLYSIRAAYSRKNDGLLTHG